MKGGTLGFFNIHSVEKLQKIEGGPFEKKISEKKSRNAEKTERGPFGLVQYCMLSGKPFWFSSLGQQGQFKILWNFW